MKEVLYRHEQYFIHNLTVKEVLQLGTLIGYGTCRVAKIRIHTTYSVFTVYVFLVTVPVHSCLHGTFVLSVMVLMSISVVCTSTLGTVKLSYEIYCGGCCASTFAITGRFLVFKYPNADSNTTKTKNPIIHPTNKPSLLATISAMPLYVFEKGLSMAVLNSSIVLTLVHLLKIESFIKGLK